MYMNNLYFILWVRWARGWAGRVPFYVQYSIRKNVEGQGTLMSSFLKVASVSRLINKYEHEFY